MSAVTGQQEAGDQPSAQDPAPLQGVVRKRLLVIVNPHASTVSARLRRLVVYGLQGRYEVDSVDTEAPGHATRLARQAAHEGYDGVVAVGGDGTVNEVANGLADSPTALTCLPGGSANVFCKLLGIPGELIDATEYLLARADDWCTRQLDLGVVNERCFTFASGLGLDASVVRKVDANPHLKARLGAYFFTWSAITTFIARYLRNPPQLTVVIDGVQHDGVTAVVQNGAAYTYFKDRPIALTGATAFDSGTLAGCVLRRANLLDMPAVSWRAFAPDRDLLGQRQVDSFVGARELIVRTRDQRPLPLQVDGDYLGAVTQAHYSVRPGALRVIA